MNDTVDYEFDVTPKQRKPIRFRLAGDPHIYVFTPPKDAVLMMPVFDSATDTRQDGGLGVGLTKSTFDWLGQGLSEADHDRVIARLKNPEDDLDVEDLTAVIESLTEKVGGRPTTSKSGSTTARAAVGLPSTGGPQPPYPGETRWPSHPIGSST